MNVTVEYSAQARAAAGVALEKIEMAGGGTVRELLRVVTERHGEALGKVLLDGNGNLHPSVLLFVDDEQAGWNVALKDGARVAIVPPMSGG